jgi:hypothetical protein
MAPRLHCKPVPIALALRKSKIPFERSPHIGMRFTPTPFTVVHLAERKADLGLKSAKCVEDETFWNQYFHTVDIDRYRRKIFMRYLDSKVYPGFYQNWDTMSRRTIQISTWKRPRPAFPYFLAERLFKISKAIELATMQTNRTSWKVDNLDVIIDETLSDAHSSSYHLLYGKKGFTADKLTHRVGYIELSTALSQQEINEVEEYPDGELASSIVERLDMALAVNRELCPQYDEQQDDMIKHAYSGWKEDMKMLHYDTSELC